QRLHLVERPHLAGASLGRVRVLVQVGQVVVKGGLEVAAQPPPPRIQPCQQIPLDEPRQEALHRILRLRRRQPPLAGQHIERLPPRRHQRLQRLPPPLRLPPRLQHQRPPSRWEEAGSLVVRHGGHYTCRG